MSESSIENKKNSTYENHWAHLSDELKRLELKARIFMLSQSFIRSDAMEQFKGIVITEEEVLGLLEHSPLLLEEHPEYLRLMEQLQELESGIKAKRATSIKSHIFLPLDYLSKVFQLSSFEEQCVVLALATELDTKYEKLYAYLQDDITKKYPTVFLALSLLCKTNEERMEARQYFDSGSKLERFFFRKDVETPVPDLTGFSMPLKLDKRMTDFLLRGDGMDSDIKQIVELTSPEEALPELLLSTAIQDKLHRFIDFKAVREETIQRAFVFNIWGPPGIGKKINVQHFCKKNNAMLLLVNIQRMLESSLDFSILLHKVHREAILKQAVLCFYNFHVLVSQKNSEDNVGDRSEASLHSKIAEIFNLIRDYRGVIFLLSDCSWDNPDYLNDCYFLSLQLPLPDTLGRKQLWESLSKGYRIAGDIHWGVMASKFKFTPGQMMKALSLAENMAAYEMPEDGTIHENVLHEACFLQSKHRLKSAATRIEAKYAWEDIILPQNIIEQLKNICNQLKYRHVVYGEWGFDQKLSYGKGLCVLLYGPPGTGKTMTVQVIANELKLELFRIDLSQVISKYIGETEKNLQRIFDQAQASNAILFFDEADAIFGKRSEVKDAHDRYANIETSYLLQKVEEYEGMSILATNFKDNIDAAFTRRIQHMVEFPFPDAAHRKMIWEKLFPKEAPLDEDVDFEFLANRFELSGGSIKNVVLSSAFLAAQEKGPIQMKHLVRALKYELHKTGRVLLKEDLGEYYSELC